MKLSKINKIKISKTSFLLLILGFSFLLISFSQNDTENKSFEVTAYTYHDPISITNDSGFSGFPGIGTSNEPYVIDGYNITTTNSEGIYITGTTKYFIIKNCYIDAGSEGILIDSIADGTATISNNTCIYNTYGIYISLSDNIIISENICTHNNIIGILIESSHNNTINGNVCTLGGTGIYLITSTDNMVEENNCSYNSHQGIYLYTGAYNNIIINNNCNFNSNNGIYERNTNIIKYNNCTNNVEDGIYLDGVKNSFVLGNNCTNNNNYGIYAIASENNQIKENICTKNSLDGIYIDEVSYNNVLTKNLISSNLGYGVNLHFTTAENSIYFNIFFHNNFGGTSQGYDDGMNFNNLWYNETSSQGNAWSDWSGIGYYSIDGMVSSYDLYPTLYYYNTIVENITHVPSSPTNTETVTISVSVRSFAGIDSVILHFRINGGTWCFTYMSLSEGSIYQVAIGPFAVDSIVDYYILAIDASDFHRETITDNDGLYYSFTVEAPVVPEYTIVPSLFLFIILPFCFMILVMTYKRKKN